MKNKSIQAYNQLNRQFYQQISADFADSRQYYWAGWQKILPILKKIQKNDKKIKILDLACGNARFVQFLKENLAGNFAYRGVDNSAALLALAQKMIENEKIESEGLEAKLNNFDLIANYLKNKQINYPAEWGQFDLIVAFGLSHHLPSQKLRSEFLASLSRILKTDGLLLISNWQFAADSARFEKNILNLEKIKKNANLNLWQRFKLKKLLNNLEKNDYILDWRRFEQSEKKAVFRYCHFLTKKEMKELIAANNLELLDSFLADGKSKKLNQYFLLKKKH